MKRGLKILGIVILIFAVAIATLYVWMTIDQNSKISQLVFEEIDMSQVMDGTYTGAASTGLVSVEARVTVAGNKITGIELLKHDNGKGGKAEVIINDMIQRNTYDVDGVSGATASSQTIKSAVCNALLKGVTKK